MTGGGLPAALERWSDGATRAGNLAALLQGYDELLGDATREMQWDLYAALRHSVSQYTAPLGDGEREQAVARCAALPAAPGLGELRDAVAERVRQLPALRVPRPGETNVLLAANASAFDRPLGAVQRLCVSSTGWDSTWVLRVAEQRGGELATAFASGRRAALAHIFGCKREGSLTRSRRLNALTFEATLPYLATPVGGSSIGLASAVCVLSYLLGQPVKPNVSVTGAINDVGVVRHVSSLEAKVLAAVTKGVTTLFVPLDNYEESVAFAAGALDVSPVEHLDDAVAALFDAHALPGALDALDTRLVDAPATPARSAGERGMSPLDAGTLLTLVGANDPWGRLPPRGEAPEGKEPGPILAIVQHARPRRALLLHTPSHAKLANAVAEEIKRQSDAVDGVACEAVPYELAGVDDPTDFAMLIPALRPRAREAAAIAEGGPLIVNVSSGTPAMLASLMLVVEQSLPGAVLLQVRERQYVRSGEERVRRAVLPI